MALEVDLSCPVCTELFRDPVLLSCGHSFCRQCINDHWTSSRSRRCSVCQQASPQQPVSNLSLRNTCESYLREQNTRTDNSGGHKCQIHGEKIELFCQIDGKALCSTCKKQTHDWHETQPLQQAVRQRKWKLKANLRAAEKTLVSLQNGTAQDNKISKYIQNYDHILNRTKCMPPDAELSSETVIDVPKYLGNLKYQVWEKMKDICPYYPVILNPNTSLPDFSVSDDLTSVTSCSHQQDGHSVLPLHRNRVVLGTVGYYNGVHTWDIEVGKSQHWSLGVCFGWKGVPLTPENGFFGLRRDGDSYRLMNSGMSKVKMRGNPEVVRVKLDSGYDDKTRLGIWS